MEGMNGMDIFASDSDIELNFDPSPEGSEYEEDITVEEQEITGEESEENIKPGDDLEDQESVTGEEQENTESSDSDEGADDDSSEPEDTSSALYSSLASVLNEEGLLPSLDLENTKIESIDDLTLSIKSEIENQVRDNLISKIGEEGYNALERGISLSEYQAYESTVNSLDSIDEGVLRDNLELAQNIIMQDYIAQGMDESRAARILKRSIDLGEEAVVEDALESTKSLRAIQDKELERISVEREEQRQRHIDMQQKIDNDLKSSIYSEKEFIKGLKPNKAIRDRVYQSITKVVGQSPEGVAENKLMRQRRENPVEFDTKLYYLYEMTDGFNDFSKLVSKSESKATSKLESAIRKTKFGSSTNPGFVSDPNSYGGIADDSELVL